MPFYLYESSLFLKEAVRLLRSCFKILCGMVMVVWSWWYGHGGMLPIGSGTRGSLNLLC